MTKKNLSNKISFEEPKLVRLTNLGNLTLKNYLDLEENYKDNASLKTEKLSKLWPSRECLDEFVSNFSGYHKSPVKSAILYEDGDYHQRYVDSSRQRLLQNRFASDMESFVELGLAYLSKAPEYFLEISRIIEKDEYKNPAKYVDDVKIELTGLCNLKCKHCYRGGSRKDESGLPVEMLKKAIEPMLRAGVKRISFTGGEPTLRKDDLLEIMDYASNYLELKGVSKEYPLEHYFGNPNATTNNLLSTKPFLEIREKLVRQLSIPKNSLLIGDWDISDESTLNDVEELLQNHAKAKLEKVSNIYTLNRDDMGILSNGYFDDPGEFLEKIRSYGNVILQVSLDSYDSKITDENRGKKGSFEHVRELVQLGHEKNFPIVVVAHEMGYNPSNTQMEETKHFFKNHSKLQEMNSIRIVGNGSTGNFKRGEVGLKKENSLGSLSSKNGHMEGWCKGFTRPAVLQIRPNGNVGNCNTGYGLPGEYGNLCENDMIYIVNNIQNSRIYNIFQDGSIEKYQHEVDKSLFPKRFTKSCEPVIITAAYVLFKEKFEREGLDNPSQMASEEVARIYKYKT